MRDHVKTLATTVITIVGMIGLSGSALAGCTQNFTSDGNYNTCIGTSSLSSATGSYEYNTAIGYSTLKSNTTGYQNTAAGSSALSSNTVGANNTAIGFNSLYSNTTGYNNTANGSVALYYNTTGVYNMAIGMGALYSNTSGYQNTAVGAATLQFNTHGVDNSATGTNALQSNTTGNSNTANGYAALRSNTTGSYNIALGYNAGLNLTTGSNNIAVGNSAGYNLTTGSNNIDIGNDGVAAEANTIRIGTLGTQTKTFLAGVRGVTATGGAAVYVTSTGQLGTVTSSRRYKEDIEPMGDVSDRLMSLQPVTFRYKEADQGGNKPIQYGLIAEDVDTVMPELVVRNADGSPETVSYHVLPSLLLNEYQKQHQKLANTEARLATLEADMEHMKQTMDRLMAALPQTTKLASTQ